MLTAIQREKKSKAWTQVRALVWGVKALSKLLGLARTTVGTWLNNIDKQIPFEWCIIISFLTGIVLEHLSPETERANKVIRVLLKPNYGCVMEIAISRILINKNSVCNLKNSDGPIIIGGDRVFISGYAQLAEAQERGLAKTSVMVIDLDSLILGVQTLDDINNRLSEDQKYSIYQRIKELSPRLFDHQGHFKKNSDTIFKTVKEKQNVCSMIGEADAWVDPKTEVSEAKHTSRDINEIIQDGIQLLMDALDQEKLSGIASTIGQLHLIEKTDLLVRTLQSSLEKSPDKVALIINEITLQPVDTFYV